MLTRRRSQENKEPYVKESWHRPDVVFGACLLWVAGCSVELSPTEPLLDATRFELTDQDHYELHIAAPGDSNVLITVNSRDVDVRLALTGSCDAPNRRMGIESLLLEPPHAQSFTVRIERNDHQEAHGFITADAIALPIATAADRQRLEAAKRESVACQVFGDLAKAADTAAAFAAAANLYARIGDYKRAGIALLHAAGARYTRLADWRGAADLASQAGRQLQEVDAPELTAFAMRIEGAALAQLANSSDADPASRVRLVTTARQRLTEAADRFAALSMAYEAGYALNYRGVSYQDSGDRHQARADFLQALHWFQQAHDKPAQALSLQSLATLSHEDGRLSDAMQEFDQALALIPRDRDAENYAHTLHNSARPLQVLGRFDEAIARYYEAAQILHRLGDQAGEARALHGIGATLRHAGEPLRAKTFLRTAIDLRSATGAKREQALSMIALGQIETEEGNTDAAVVLHNQAVALVNVPTDRAIVLLALVQDHAAAGNLSRARQELKGVLELNLPVTHRYLGLALTELGDVESREGNHGAAADAFARAIAIHRTNGSELDQAQTLYRRAGAMMRAGNRHAALTDTEDSLRLFDEIGIQGTQAESRASFRASYRGVVELRIAVLLADAATAKARGDSSQAQRLLQAALTASDRSRAQLLTNLSHDVPTTLLARRSDIYELLAGKRQRLDRLLDAAVPDTGQLAALNKDIALLRAEATLVESRLAKSQSALASPSVSHTGELALAIPPNVLVAEYFLGDKQSWLFKVQRGEIEVHELPDASALESLARELHLAWRSPTSAASDDRLAVAHHLASLVLTPLGQSIPDNELRIIPDGALHLVPMAVLAQQLWPMMRPGTAVVVPSMSAMYSKHEDRVGNPAKWLAVIADPVFTADDPRIHAAINRPSEPLSARLLDDALLTRSASGSRALRRLPSTGVEALDVINSVNRPSETLALLGTNASRTRIATAPLHEYRILHFATHALADSQDPALATLALSRWDANGNPVDGALRLYDITQLHLNADLVVLSGCDTALGREIGGEGPISLAHAFLRTGARSVVSTLWQVSDTSTAVLMREFYRQLINNHRDAAIALQLAQDHVRRQRKWSDPYFWAGFQLVSMARIDSNNSVEGRRE